MKKIRAWFRKNKRAFLITDFLLLITTVAILVATANPADVQGLTIDTTYNTASLTWDAAKNAKGYRVYRSRNGGKYKYLDYTADTSFEDKDLRTGDTYSYAIASRNGFLTSDISDAEKLDVVPSLEKPVLEVDTSKGEMMLKFGEIDGAICYEVIRNGEVIDTIEDTDYVDHSAKSDKEYKYEVRAVRYKKKPVYSKFSNKEKGVLHAVQNFKIKTMDNNIVFTWNPSEYYTTYKLYNGNHILTETDEGQFTMSDYKLDKVYDISLVGYASDNTRSPECERRIMATEEDMTSEEACDEACEWAVDIANDNSFTYGTGARAHRPGCYFCGTNVGPNMNKKGKSKVSGHSYAKTYCCNPFVTACFAHGAGDPGMLSACSRGKTVEFTPGSFTRYGPFKNVGKPGYGNLKKGDVLVMSAHVMIYIGDGRIAHAKSSGWGAGSITTDKASGYYKRSKFVMRYTGSGRGKKLVIKDVDEKGNPIEEESSEG
ncbi:MAG: hypothetical protein IJG48_09590 [Mogibacterium sp.]|jgi:hypothetical protein|nr:hypothetical protein [Mogibacterium sp.]